MQRNVCDEFGHDGFRQIADERVTTHQIAADRRVAYGALRHVASLEPEALLDVGEVPHPLAADSRLDVAEGRRTRLFARNTSQSFHFERDRFFDRVFDEIDAELLADFACDRARLVRVESRRHRDAGDELAKPCIALDWRESHHVATRIYPCQEEREERVL